MKEELEDVKRRLVIRRKLDGRGVYDPQAKADLVALCMRPGMSKARIARECGLNANQVSRWLREHVQGGRRSAVARTKREPSAFMPVALVAATAKPVAMACQDSAAMAINLQAHLPNGVRLELGGMQPQHVGQVIEMLGRLACSASTKD